MTVVLVVLLVVLVLLTGALLVVLVRALRPAEPGPAAGLLEQKLRERFIVTTVDGSAFTGLLSDVDERTVVLVDGASLQGTGTADARAVPIDGELLLPRATIAYLQRP